MKKMKRLSPFKLSSLLRQEKDPKLAFHLFLNPTSTLKTNHKSFPYSLLSYDLIITKLGRAKMFDELQLVLSKLKLETRFTPTEIIFCNVITYYSRARLPQRAIQVFDEIPSFGCQRTVKSFNTLLNGLLICREFEKMNKIFMGIDLFTCPDACSYNIMINACRMQGNMVGAWKVFDEMRERRIRPNEVTFSTLIAGMCSSLHVNEALKLKNDMERVYNVKPNQYVYGSLIKGLCDTKQLNLALQLKDEMIENNIEVDSTIYTTFISALFKIGKKDMIKCLLQEMKRVGCTTETETYNALIAGYCSEKHFDLALQVLDKLEKTSKKPDVTSYNVIINAYFSEGKIREAIDLFEDMPRRGCKPEVVSYRIVVQGLLNGMKVKEVAYVLDEMMFKGYAPHIPTVNKFLTLLYEDENFELLLEVVNSLAKMKYIDTNTWAWVVSKFCVKHEVLNFLDVFEALTNSTGVAP